LLYLSTYADLLSADALAGPNDQAHHHCHRRTLRGREEYDRAIARAAARVHLHRHRGDVSRDRPVGPACVDRSRRFASPGAACARRAYRILGRCRAAEWRRRDCGHAASKVAVAPGVRHAMRDEQRRIGAASSVVMEGRDIGTVVFPDAQVKIYLDADPEVRVGRRAKETGAAVAQVARAIAERDQRDRSRREAPLTQALDAEYLDSTGLTPGEVEEAILKIIRQRTSN